MKKALLTILALMLMTATAAIAQEGKPSTGGKKAAAGAAEVTLMGKIGDDGKTFTSDKDGKTWTLVNPDAVQGHAGHHVALSGHLNPDAGQIHVMSVKMAGQSKVKKGAESKQ